MNEASPRGAECQAREIVGASWAKKQAAVIVSTTMRLRKPSLRLQQKHEQRLEQDRLSAIDTPPILGSALFVEIRPLPCLFAFTLTKSFLCTHIGYGLARCGCVMRVDSAKAEQKNCNNFRRTKDYTNAASRDGLTFIVGRGDHEDCNHCTVGNFGNGLRPRREVRQQVYRLCLRCSL